MRPTDEELAGLLERVFGHFNGGGSHQGNILLLECRDVAAKLRADCERSVPVGACACSPGDTCCCAYDCDCRERYSHEYQPNLYDEEWVNTGATLLHCRAVGAGGG